MNTLITGSSGLLGRHLDLLADRPTHAELDITKPVSPKNYDLIVHCAAFTDVEGAETSQMKCFEVNVIGTLNLLEAYPKVPFVYISSEYAKTPVNFYAMTKKVGEVMAEYHKPSLIIRTLFKPRPWRYPKAFVDAYTEGDYVDVIAPLIKKEILSWDRKTNKLVYVGTGRKTIFELAKQTRDVEPISVDDIKGVSIPKDYL